MTAMVSNAQLDRLGRAIRDGTMTPADEQLLAEMRSLWGEALASVMGELESEFVEDVFEITGRVKNLETLREKLQRLDGGLSTIRDVVGCRVVVRGGRDLQVEAVQRIAEVFRENQPRVISRIADPRAGYRAVHVEIRHGPVRAEIQIRTIAQHEWAESMERFGDRVGRAIRYDDDSFAHLPAEVGGRARDCLVALMKWSDAIDLWERRGSRPDGEAMDGIRRAEAEWKMRLEEFDASL